MSTRMVFDSIPRYRKFARWSSVAFKRYFVCSWLLGCAAVLAVSILRLDKRYGISIDLVMLLTIWPAIICWLAVSGFLVLWHLAVVAFHALRDRERPDWRGALLFLSFLAMGVVFLGGGIGLLYAVLWRVLAKT